MFSAYFRGSGTALADAGRVGMGRVGDARAGAFYFRESRPPDAVSAPAGTTMFDLSYQALTIQAYRTNNSHSPNVTYRSYLHEYHSLNKLHKVQEVDHECSG